MTFNPARCACGRSRLSRPAPYQPEVLPPVRTHTWCNPAAFACATTRARLTRLSAQVVSHMPLPRTGSTRDRCAGTATGAGSAAVFTAGLGAWNGGPGGNGGGGHGDGEGGRGRRGERGVAPPPARGGGRGGGGG